MQAKIAVTIALAVLFPIASYFALRWHAPTTGLGLVDFLLLTLVVLAMGHDPESARSGVKASLMILGIVLAAGLFYVYEPSLLAYLPPPAISGLFAWLFLRSLSKHREPFITRFATIERGGELPEELAAYTRLLTWIWGLFFVGLALESISLAAFASMETYLLFANCLNYALVALLFLLEYLYRRIRFRHHWHPSPLRYLRVLLSQSAVAAGKSANSRLS